MDAPSYDNNDDKQKAISRTSRFDEIERQRQILHRQWGRQYDTKEGENGQTDEEVSNRRHVHLYDGYALAVYLVSQLQFIDPLNRRDLTRDELLSLDAYCRFHARHFPHHQTQKRRNTSSSPLSSLSSLLSLNAVTEAYDDKGNTLSRAGSAAATPDGRAEMLQQEAATIFCSLFHHKGDNKNNKHSKNKRNGRRRNEDSEGTSNNKNNSGLSISHAYLAHEQRQNQQQQQTNPTILLATTRGRVEHDEDYDSGIYADGRGGIMIIDDDKNPGLRGGNPLFAQYKENDPTTTETSTSFQPRCINRPFTFSQWSTGRLGLTGGGARAYPSPPQLHLEKTHQKSVALAKIAVSKNHSPNSRNAWKV